MRVAVPGSTGFVGRHVVARLRNDGVEVRALTRTDLADLPAALAGCDAAVNLVGVKRGDFEGAHVGFVERLVAAGVPRLVHVSVVAARPDPHSPYHDTKWRGEEIVRRSALDWTILRPGVIYGHGDDMLSHLSKMIRASRLFPVVGRGTSLLQPVHVEDVAAAVAAALREPGSIGKTYELVGPEPLELREIVRRTAEALERPLIIAPTPPVLMRPAVRVMSWLMKHPLSTPPQLKMLEEGMTGDPGPAERELGIRPRPFAVEGIRPIVAEVAPPALRLRFDERLSRRPFVLVALLAVVAVNGVFLSGVDPFAGIVATNVALAGISLAWIGREAFDVRGWDVPLGLAAAGVMAVAAKVVLAVPEVAAEAAGLFAWLNGRGPLWTVLGVAVAAAAEEVVWRGVVTRGLAGRMPLWAAATVGAALFAAAHAASGTWLLPAAAFAAGLAWGKLYLATGRLAAPVLCHVVWDLVVLGGS